VESISCMELVLMNVGFPNRCCRRFQRYVELKDEFRLTSRQVRMQTLEFFVAVNAVMCAPSRTRVIAITTCSLLHRYKGVANYESAVSSVFMRLFRVF